MKTSSLLLFILLSVGLMAQQAIDTTEVVSVGGIRQFITIKGKDRSNPLFLFLHGGPGGSVLNYADKFTGLLQEKFVVVQWDQRETGKTLALNASPVPLTLSLFENDTHEIVTALLQQFKRKKIYLAGHSWGTVLAFSMADQHPELLYACIAISPVVNQVESEKILLDKMKEKLKENPQATGELSTVKVPFETSTDLYYDRKWLPVYNGKTIEEVNKTFPKSYALAWSDTWLPLWTEATKLNRLQTLLQINCPVYFMTGRDDLQTNAHITEQYFKKVKAPAKELYWFEKSKHAIPTTEPTLMQEIIINKILPATWSH